MIVADFVSTLWSAAGHHVEIFGMCGLVLGFVAAMMPHRHGILLTSAACAACFGLHYWTLGALTGTAMCGVSVMQNLVSARFVGPQARAGWVVPLFAASSLGAGCLTLATWQGWVSGFAGVGALLATAARLQVRPTAMRLLFLGASLCWAFHNGLVGSVFALTCDLMTMSGLVVALLRAGPKKVGRGGFTHAVEA